MQEIVFKMGYLERRSSKTLQGLTLFFISKPISFNEQDHKKQKGSETSEQSLIRL